MKVFIDTMHALIPSVSIGYDHSVYLVLRTVDWQQHHSLVMSPDEARYIADKLLRAADEATACLPQDPTRDNPERAREAQEASDRG